jgi:ABC-type phosphate transport system auxiliary subunit
MKEIIDKLKNKIRELKKEDGTKIYDDFYGDYLYTKNNKQFITILKEQLRQAKMIKKILIEDLKKIEEKIIKSITKESNKFRLHNQVYTILRDYRVYKLGEFEK